MRHIVRFVTFAGVLGVAAWLGMPQLAARQVAPGPPTGLTYVVDTGGRVTLRWTHSTGAFTHYRLEAGAGPGHIFYIFDSIAAAQPGALYGKSPELVASFGAGGVGDGNYYVRMRGVNGSAFSAPSNEVVVPIRAGCHPPGAPTNYGSIIRGTAGLLHWNTGNGGRPTNYVLLASYVPNDPAPPFRIPLGDTTGVFFGIPPATYYTTIVATNACGVSGRSNEIIVTSPSTTADRTPDPPPGQRLPMPAVAPIVAALAQDAINRGYMVPSTACPNRTVSHTDATAILEGRKTQPNAYINHIVAGLRQWDRRFGYNAKPVRSWVPAIIAGDEIAYHYGSDAPEGSPNTFAVDVLGGHCTGVGVISNNDVNRHTPVFRPFFDEFVRWTAAGLFVP